MFLARRSVALTRPLLCRQSQRRFESHSASDDHYSRPVNESYGPSFYIAISTVAAWYVLYRVTKSNKESSSESWISGLIKKYTPPETLWEERNAIRTAIMEKAAVDRHLFTSATPSETIDLKTPEVFNAGSPFNVAAGTTADLSAVVAHYRKLNQKIEENRVARLKDGKVVSIYD